MPDGKVIKENDVYIGIDYGKEGDYEAAVAVKMHADGTMEVIGARQFYRGPDEFIDGEAMDITDQKLLDAAEPPLTTKDDQES